MYDENLINKLFDVCKNKEPVVRTRICAAITSKDLVRPIIATNSFKTHPLQYKFKKNPDSIHLHAEVNVVVKALKVLSQEQLSKSDLYVMRAKFVDETWKYGLAKPCSGCQQCISAFGFRNVFYSDEPDMISQLAY